MASPDLDIHLIAIGGTGMAPLACLLKGRGHRVRGSDAPLYPPMSTLLEEAGIKPLIGFDPEHLRPRPDLVVVGNAVPRHNPEAVEAERLELPRISMPEALARFFLHDRRPLVVAGTHGKTSTTSLAAWVWACSGRDPGFLVGGVPRNFGRSFREGGGARFIIEGDEYNAAYFDRGPKFLHYRPETLILTSVEYDHADLYPDPESLLARYRELVELLPSRGLLVACGDLPGVREIAAGAPCRVVFYGLDAGNEIRPAEDPESGPAGVRLRVTDPQQGAVSMTLPLSGSHSVRNALAVWAAARNDGIGGEEIGAAFASFRGVLRRADELGTARGVTVVDDFAHHPTAVETTLAGLRGRYPGRRLIAVYEPRTLTAGRGLFFASYLRAFRQADRVFLAPVFHAGRLDESQRLDPAALAAELERDGVPTLYSASADQLLDALLSTARQGDLVAVMSSGSFEGLAHRLFEALSGSDDPETTDDR